MKRSAIRLLALLAFANIYAGCGDDPASRDNIVTVDGDMGGTELDAGTSSGGDASSELDDGGEDSDPGDAQADMELDPCATVDCPVGERCEEGSCIARDICDEALDAGMLTFDAPVTVDGSFLTSGSNVSTAACGEADQLEHLVRFELTEPAEVAWSVDWGGQFDGLVALRTACDDPESETECSDLERGSALLEAGVYHLYLEVRLGNPGDFSVELEASAPGTCQAGTATCNADERVICVDGTTTSVQTCPDTCTDGACAGDSCATPITVTGSGGTWSGTGSALTSALEFAANLTCAESAGMSTSTPGYDLVFYLPALQAGTVISVDAATGDGNVNDIFIQRTCGATEMCSDAYQTTETPDFVVTNPGDYYVIIEKRQASNAPFQYSITLL